MDKKYKNMWHKYVCVVNRNTLKKFKGVKRLTFV